MAFRKQLFFLWAAVFFSLHLVNALGLLDLKIFYVFFLMIFVSLLCFGSVLMFVGLFYYVNKEKEVEFFLPGAILPVLFWLAAVLSVNIDFFSNFSLEGAKYLGTSLVEISREAAIALYFLLSAFVAGRKILSLLGAVSSSKAENVLFSVALGIGFWGNLFFLLAVLKLGYGWIAFGLLAIPLLSGYQSVKSFLFWLFKSQVRIVVGKNGLWEKFAWMLLLGLLLLGFVYSLANLSSAGWDTFHQYLTFADAYRDNHGLVAFPFHPHWGFPQLGEMTFFAGLLLGGVQIPFLLNYFFVALGFWGFARVARKPTSIWPLLILASVPLLMSFQFGYLKVEGLLFFFLVMIFLVLRKISEDRSRTSLWTLLAVFLGLALSVKYTAVFVIFGVVIALTIFWKNYELSWKKIFLIGAVIFAVFSPWLVKNLVYYHSPLYPIFSGQDYFSKTIGENCQGFFVDSCREDNFLVRQKDLFIEGKQFASDFLIFLKAFFIGDPFGITEAGPFVVILIPLVVGLCLRKKDRFMKFMAVFTGIYFLEGLFFFTGQIWYFLPAILSFLFLVAYLFQEKDAFVQSAFIKSLVLFWIFSIFSVFILGDTTFKKIKYIRGETGLESVLADGDVFRMSQYINSNIIGEDGQDVLVYSFPDTQGYFIKDSFRHFVPDFYGYLFECISQNGRAYENMKKLGVDYLIFGPDEYPVCSEGGEKFFTCRTQKDFLEFIHEHGELVHREGGSELYRLE